MPPKLGILAGGGLLPRYLIEAAQAQGRDVFVIAFRDHADADLTHNTDHKWLRLGAVGEAIEALKAAGCVDLVMGGNIRRPSLAELRPDWRGVKFFARTGAALLGDDGLLKAVRKELEGEGFNLLGPQDILHSLLTPEGVLTQTAPTDEHAVDINRGIAVLNALAPVDVGQAVAVEQGLVLGIEAIEGTAQLILRCGALKREGGRPVLVKLSKTEQDRQLDVPAIGPDTIDQLVAAGFAGLALEAGRSFILGREQVIAKANAAGLFISGVRLLA